MLAPTQLAYSYDQTEYSAFSCSGYPLTPRLAVDLPKLAKHAPSVLGAAASRASRFVAEPPERLLVSTQASVLRCNDGASARSNFRRLPASGASCFSHRIDAVAQSTARLDPEQLDC